RSRGLGILTFDKIKKKAFAHNLIKYDFIYRDILPFCQNQTHLEKTNSKNFLWESFTDHFISIFKKVSPHKKLF
ncbi:MAG: hypothetical protein J6C86_12020, partial [Bacteroidaceae bacterium]|nr:hypothetical protein [Bacteroidaceae bacterium]